MKLAIIGDLHFSAIDERNNNLYNARKQFYHFFLQEFFKQQADLHISLGDLTNYGLQAELDAVYELIKHSERKFIHVLGNHDLYAQPRLDVLQSTGQARYHSIKTEDAVFAFLDTAKEMNYENWGGTLDKLQLEWLEQVVVDSGEKPLFVFGHHPVYATTKRSDREMGSIDQDIDVWSILQKKTGIGLYFNGHTHIDSIEKRENWTFVQLAACLDVPAMRIVEVTEHEINITAVDVTDEKMLAALPLIYQEMEHFTHQENVRGENKDREIQLLLSEVVK